MKIGYLLDTTLDSNDGVQQYVKTLGNWMAQNGLSVTYLAGETNLPSEAGQVHSLSRNIDIGSNSNTISVPLIIDFRKILNVMESNEFDIIHVQAPFSPFLAGSVLALSDSTKIATIHTYPANILYELGSRVIPLLQKGVYDKFSKVIAVSEPAKEYAQNILKIDEVDIVPNTVDLERFKKAKAIKKYKDGKINILFLGRLVKRKGAKYLIKAFEKLDEELRNRCRLLIAGTGKLENELKELADNTGISNVEFLGFVKEELKPSLYATADICVFPSTEGESFGIVLLEAMAAGSSILAFRNEGYESVLSPEIKYSLVDNKDTGQLALKLSRLILDPKKRKEISTKSKEYVKKFDIEIVGPKILKIYKEAIKNKT